MANAEVFDSFFRRADLDRDGRISGTEAVGFFQGSGLPQATLAKIWQFSDKNRAGFLSRQEFINALKLVTIAQTGRDLTPELVKAALNGPTASIIPPPRINVPIPPHSNFGQTPPAQTPPTAPQGSYGQQFPSQSGYGQQLGSQGGLAHPQSLSLGGAIPQMSQPQGRFLSVGSMPQGASMMQQPPRPGFSTAAPGMTQTRPTLGGLMGNSSQPSGTQFSSSPGLSTGVELQSSVISGLPRPTAPNGMLSTAASLPSTTKVPPVQASGAGGLKSGPGSFSLGDLYGAPIPTRPAGAGPTPKSKSTPELQSLGETFRTDPVGPTALGPTILLSSSSLGSEPSGVSQTTDFGSGYGVRSLSGPGVTSPWPQMTSNDVQRYTRVFSEVDTDHDGKITGEQARQLFLGWQLPREVLKQVWNLSDQDGDSMLSIREFCTALYLMERFREGRPLPPSLPPGIHLDDPRGSEGLVPAAQRPGYGASNWQQEGNLQQMGPGSGSVSGPGPIRPTLLTTPAGQMHLQNLTSSGAAGAEPSKDAFGEFNFLNKRKQSEKEVSNSMPAPNALPVSNTMSRSLDIPVNKVIIDRRLMDHREKSAYYRTKLQEIVLFKSRCDNKLSEITEKAAADKREVDSLAKKYDEKFKAAAEVNAQLAVENANLRDAQEKKLELVDALFKMEHGGDPNALLQKRANHIATDLDKLKKALRDRGQLLGVEVNQKIPKEMPFGWMQNTQEKAAEWIEWDALVDRDFSVVEALTDDTVITEKAPAAASLGKEEENSLDSNINHKIEVPSNSDSGLTDKTSQNPSEASPRAVAEVSASDVSSAEPSDIKPDSTSSIPTTKSGGRYANVTESQEFGSDLFNSSTAASSPTSSSEVGRGSFTPDAFAGIGSSWGFGSNDDDADIGPRASWSSQSNPPSTQASLDVTNSRGATRFSKSSASFGQEGSFDLGSPRTSSIDGTSSPTRVFERNETSHSHDFDSRAFGSKHSNRNSSLFGGNLSPKAASLPSLFGGSPRASKQDDGFKSFSRFDSFGPGSPLAPTRASGEDRPSNFFNRLDSFSSVHADGAKGSGFHSDDESDIFSASGPFSAKQSQVSDGWKAF
ncbi:uncharacterized protein [Physcomitrium patens]|uniref:Uncharacterized protein n=2 Tax=Physcomitrium patens TaxID=3218 RepID=A0A2K1L846_PHYPA|nr:epidermal growth factor receptor substrate 15-like isoform X1 [Physcomitrium patens]XP_024382168.1 epidermal growth factor receptor substrate 15-like isoform X1 [Physcomitrium patens]PNR62218.1 hypothetical protein PHYPA_000642 [Physcomitrium patens]|eukprot:XP_024382161.1 epidermal growth factor receptor substrate 15-like isoform X1 [Physcomitrella patens]